MATYGDLKMPSQPMDMSIDLVEKHEECEQVNESIKYVGWNSKGKGRGKGKGKGKSWGKDQPG